MTHDNTPTGKTESTPTTRRQILKRGFGGLATAAVLPGLAAASDDRKVIRVKKQNWRHEIDRIRDTDGVTVETKEDEYVVTVDKSVLPDATAQERQNLRRKMEKSRDLAKQEIQSKLSGISSDQVTPAATVSLGNDETLDNMTDGISGSSGGGYVTVVAAGSNSNTTADRATAAVLGTVGVGSVTYYATVGVPFTVTGSGSQSATVTGVGFYRGQITTLGAGQATVTIDFKLRNNSTGSTYSTNLANVSRGVASLVNFQDSYNASLSANLQAGDSYMAFTRVSCTIGVGSVGEADADAGPQDNDDYNPPQGSDLDQVEIRF